MKKTALQPPQSAFPTDADQGLSMRDYFAASAIQGLAERPMGGESCTHVAMTAYKLADAMLDERVR